MASYPNNVKIQSDVKPVQKFDLKHVHQSTASFGRNNVALIKELTPGSKIDIGMSTFARLNPMPAPTLGRIGTKNQRLIM